MPSIKTRETVEQETTVTSDYCYAQAAQALVGNYTVGNGPEYANQWRLLGDSLAAKGE